MNYVQYYGRRLAGGQERYGAWSLWETVKTVGEVLNPVSAGRTYRKRGVTGVFKAAKEEVAESGLGVFNPLKSVEDRKQEDAKRRKDIAVQRKKVLAAEKRKIDAEIAREKAKLAKLVSADDIPAHLRDGPGDKGWKTYAGYAAAGIFGVGVLYYGRRYFNQKKKVAQ